jgi:Fe-S cluster biogenesis protein NfuA
MGEDRIVQQHVANGSTAPVLVPFDDVAARVDELVTFFERHPDPEIRDRVVELLQCVDALHRSPLKRLVALLETYQWDGGAGASIPPLERARSDPLISRLLELYDLLPLEVDPRQAVEEALAEVRPYIESHGGSVHAVAVADGVVTIELSGHCRGCTASQLTLRGVIEQVLRARVRGFQRMEVVPPAEPATPHPPPARPVISLEQLMAELKGRAARREKAPGG